MKISSAYINNSYIINIFIFLFFVTNNKSFCEIIQLKDGSQINGVIEKILDNEYIIKTNYGILNVRKEEIIENNTIDKSTLSTISENYQINNSTITIKDISANLFRTIISSEVYKRIYIKDDIIIATVSHNLKTNEITYEGSIIDGEYYEYNEDGTLKSKISISSGVENGVFLSFYPDGKLKIKANFLNGVLNGDFFFMSPNQQILVFKNYKNGFLDGESVEYDLSGNVIKKRYYYMGKIEKEENFDNKQKEEIPLKAKKIKLARGYKYAIYKNNKYKGYFIVNNYNKSFFFNPITTISFNLPDGHLKIYDENNILQEEFILKNDLVKIYYPHKDINTYIYDIYVLDNEIERKHQEILTSSNYNNPKNTFFISWNYLFYDYYNWDYDFNDSLDDIDISGWGISYTKNILPKLKLGLIYEKLKGSTDIEYEEYYVSFPYIYKKTYDLNLDFIYNVLDFTIGFDFNLFRLSKETIEISLGKIYSTLKISGDIEGTYKETSSTIGINHKIEEKITPNLIIGANVKTRYIIKLKDLQRLQLGIFLGYNF